MCQLLEPSDGALVVSLNEGNINELSLEQKESILPPLWATVGSETAPGNQKSSLWAVCLFVLREQDRDVWQTLS